MGTGKHYTIEQGTSIKKTFYRSDHQVIIADQKELEKHSKEKLFKSVTLTYVLSNIVIPLFVKHVPKLLYNPKNYIKEHDASNLFFNGQLRTEGFKNIEGIVYSKRLFENDKDGGVNAIKIIFAIGFVNIDNDNTKSVNYIELKDVIYNYTNAKLRSAKDSINLNIEVVFKYLDEDSNQKEIALQSYFLNNVKPTDNKSAIGEFSGSKRRLLPKMHVIISVKIKVTEINSNKKHMDAWLTAYNEHSDKLKGLLLKSLKKD